MGATKKDRRINAVLSVLLTILCIAWMYPVFMILMNSLKTERAITIPTPLNCRTPKPSSG